MIGIVIAEVLQSLGADNVRVKWPNDIYLQDRKLSGILVELTGKTGDAAQIVSGAGINLVMRRVESDIVNQGWISLQEAGVFMTVTPDGASGESITYRFATIRTGRFNTLPATLGKTG